MEDHHEQKQRRLEDIQRRFRAIDQRLNRGAKIRQTLRAWRIWILMGICFSLLLIVLLKAFSRL
jgi:hypothetical protein